MLVILLVTIVAGSVYTYSSKKLKSGMADMNIKQLSQIEVFADTYVFKNAEIFAAQNFMLFQKGGDTDKLYGNEKLNSRFFYSYYKNLEALVESDQFIDSVHIYLPHRKMLVSSNGISYFNDTSRYTGFASEKKEIFERALVGERWISTYKNSNGKNVITFVVKYSPGLDVIPKAMIAIDINEESIQTAFSNMGRDDDINIAIIDESGRMISNSDKALLYSDISEKRYIKRILQNRDDSGWFVSRINGNKKLVSFFKSEYNNWNYISIKNIDAIFSANKVIWGFTVMIFILALITGLIGVYFVSKSYYMPIHNLATFVGALTGRESAGKNAYSVLSGAISQMDDDIKRYKKFTEDILPIVKNNFAYEILHNGNISKEYLEKQYMIIDIPKDSRAFTVIEFLFDNSESDFSPYFEYSLTEYLNSLNSESRVVLCLSRASAVTAVICAADAGRLGVTDLLSDIQKLFDRDNDINLRVYVGETADDIKQISDMYKRILAMKKYSFVYSGFYILYLKEVEARERSDLKIDRTRVFKNLKLCIDNGEEQKMLSVLSEVLGRFKNEAFSYDYIRGFLMHLMDFISDLIKERNIEAEEILKEKDMLYEAYKSNGTLDQIMGFVQDICMSIIYENKSYPKDYEISKKVKEFIDALPNEEMKNVTLLYIADKMMLSQAYISRMFKNETGEKFINYLTSKKLERCAELLSDRHMKVKDVCDIMGYSNSNYFIKKFREKYGVTPKQYQFKKKQENKSE